MGMTLEGKKIGELNNNGFINDILNTDEPPAVKDQRVRYIKKAIESDLPGVPDEAWRRIDLSDVDIDQLRITNTKINIKADVSNRLVEKGLIVKNIKEILAEQPKVINTFLEKWRDLNSKAKEYKDTSYSSDIKETKFRMLSESLFRDGVFIQVPDNTRIDEPIIIEIIQPEKDTVIFPQIYIDAGKQSELSLMIEHKSEDDFKAMSLGIVKTVLDKNAKVELLNYQNFGKNIMNYHSEYFLLKQGSTLTYNTVITGGASSMWESEALLLEKEAEANFNGMLSTNGHQYAGNRINIKHYSPHTYSNLLFNSVLKDESNTMFIGKIKMPKFAQKCKGYQTNNNLILGKQSKAITIPILEIIADDVECSHGATAGSIDKDKIFYLTSRGISESEAENIIMKAFYEAVLSRMSIIRNHKHINDYIVKELSRNLNIRLEEDEH